jgi:3-(3-hydroxy-phenyl)propionate hydroxylase
MYRYVHIALRGGTAPAERSFENIEGRLLAGVAPYGRCLVLRPDRTVMHDAPIEDVDRLVRESLDLLDGPRN